MSNGHRSIPLAVLVAVLLLPWREIGLSGQARQLPYATDHVLVKFKSAVRAVLPAVAGNQLSTLQAHLGLPAGTTLEEPVVNRLLREQALRVGKRPDAGVNLERFLYLKLPPGLTVEECVARLKEHPWIEYVEPDGIASPALVPSDPEFMDQWFHTNRFNIGADIHTPLAWAIAQFEKRLPNNKHLGKLIANIRCTTQKPEL